MRRLLAALALLAVAACGDDRPPLVVGGKTFTEGRIVAEMIAALAEEQGIETVRRIGAGASRVTLEALKRGDIDVYPEYTGTGLVMLGRPPMTDPDAALATVRELYAPLDLIWGERLGFSNTYGLAMRRDRARALGIETISDLAAEDSRLVLGIEEDFRTRPVDGVQALLRRYGLDFADTVSVPLDDRPQLYDRLLDGDADLIEVYTTDPQIEDFDLVMLRDDLAFFPVYEAAPLAREAALARYPALATALGRLAGRLDSALMRRLNGRVELLGEDPALIARSALAELGLVSGVAAAAARTPLTVAVSPAAAADGEAAAALRATRAAFPGRIVELAPSLDPLGAVAAGEARVAMVGAPAFFEARNGEDAPRPREGFEAVGLVGESLLHVLALNSDIETIRDAGSVATGPEGSTSYRAAVTLEDGLGLDARLIPLAADNPEGLARALLGSGADIAALMAPAGNETVEALLAEGARLLSVPDWGAGANRVVYPWLLPARLTSDDYAGLRAPVETLSAQLLMAGPARAAERNVGDQGPGASFIPGALPLAAETVRALDDALGRPAEINPVIPRAAALTPGFPAPPAAINPAPDVSILTVGVIGLLVWLGWLLFRPEYR